MELKNLTPFSTRHLVVPNLRGDEELLVLVKATFDVRGGTPRLHEVQEPVALADEYWGEPGKTSIKVAADTALLKPGVDVVYVGSAYSTAQNRYQVDVRMRVGQLVKSLRVSADRVWEGDTRFASPQWVAPFERMPMTWERAFGGTDESAADAPEWEPRNPVGSGFRSRKSKLPIAGACLPNIEHPNEPVRAPADRLTPWGVAWIAPSWQPRASYGGTCDELWQKKRAPLLPTDFNPVFFQAAPPDQVFSGELLEGTPVELHNLSPAGRLSFALPAPRVEAVIKIGDDRRTPPMRCDTIVLDGDGERVMMVWRGSVPVRGRVYDVDWVKVDLAKVAGMVGA